MLVCSGSLEKQYFASAFYICVDKRKDCSVQEIGDINLGANGRFIPESDPMKRSI